MLIMFMKIIVEKLTSYFIHQLRNTLGKKSRQYSSCIQFFNIFTCNNNSTNVKMARYIFFFKVYIQKFINCNIIFVAVERLKTDSYCCTHWCWCQSDISLSITSMYDLFMVYCVLGCKVASLYSIFYTKVTHNSSSVSICLIW